MTRFLEQQREALARSLKRHVAGEVRFDAPSRKLYATDASIYQIEPFGVVVVLSDGSKATFGSVDAADWERKARGNTLEATVYRESRRLVEQNLDEIVRRFPRILRRVSGYNLDALAGTAVLVGPAASRPS